MEFTAHAWYVPGKVEGVVDELGPTQGRNDLRRIVELIEPETLP